MSTRRFRPHVPGRPVHVPRETFRPFLPFVHSVDLQDVPHPARPSIVVAWRHTGYDTAGPHGPSFDT
ncbi:hypothetical protein OG948_54705 (plasmid) [Embleya sp. NBC_00888]|uniref:hypothetical protein n=1 Tax=Embleya sp. NBC_00888 TaxID=2975960 RepID=UPI002F91B0E5|nr:hypothetical protein OG948_54705 [Embleya sp. NBC_00888]